MKYEPENRWVTDSLLENVFSLTVHNPKLESGRMLWESEANDNVILLSMMSESIGPALSLKTASFQAEKAPNVNTVSLIEIGREFLHDAQARIKSVLGQPSPTNEPIEIRYAPEKEKGVIVCELSREEIEELYANSSPEAVANVAQRIRTQLRAQGIDDTALGFRGLHQPNTVPTVPLIKRYGTDRFDGYSSENLPTSMADLNPIYGAEDGKDTLATPNLETALFHAQPRQEDFISGRQNSILVCYDASKLSMSRYAPGREDGETWPAQFHVPPIEALAAVVVFVPEQRHEDLVLYV